MISGGAPHCLVSASHAKDNDLAQGCPTFSDSGAKICSN